ncbi:MAG: hypothetical protein NC340_06710 [Ruminococcus flavefaciens]|nr:hypothetical protein [Ruminococcus flavefaciens]MCM1229769.1 hypothetical protein [Ruminococcus flavefaciens]
MWDIFDWLGEYWFFLAGGVLILCFLINKSTRKLILKIFGVGFLVVFAGVAIMLGSMWIFGADNGAVVGILVIFNLIVLLFPYMSIGEMRRVIRLHKKGLRTYGAFIRYGSRGGSVIEYGVDGRKYEYHTDSLEKYKIGCNEVPVLYDSEKPEDSCVEKHDFIPATALVIASVFLETGMIIITVIFYFAVFS